MADVPGSGTLAIRQEGNTVRLNRTDTDGQLAARATIGAASLQDEVLRIDGTEYTETRGQVEFRRTGRWDGEKLILRAWAASAERGMAFTNEWVTSYSIEGSELRVETVGRNRVVLFYKRVD